MTPPFLRKLLLLFVLLVLPFVSRAGEVRVAVAANFAAPMKMIAQEFKKDTGHQAIVALGATGRFYAQIKYGAPFAVLLAADTATPARLEKDGLAVVGTRFTYASGRLVLWSKKPGVVDAQGDILKWGSFNKIAMANPKLAPYGAAAMEVIQTMGLRSVITPKMVEGANIGQTFQFVASQNASIGFVALSQVYEAGKIKEGSGWIVPSDLHQPIRQDAILLHPGKDNLAAQALMQYLRSDKSKAVMRSFGYNVP
jgi:molybdate transport system substrate-binding protein